MTTVTGVVEKKAGTGKGIMIDGNWYNTGFPDNLAHVNVGDNIEFSTKGKFINGKPKMVGGSPAPASRAAPSSSAPPSDIKISRDRSIARQNALQHAARIVAAQIGTGCEFDDVSAAVISMAQDFEMYSTGELDEAEKKTFTATEEKF